MFGKLLPLIFAIGVLGCVIYGLVAAIKPALGKWGKTSKGKALLSVLPLLLGALGGVALNELQGYAASLFGSDAPPEMARGAGAMMGLFAGTFSTYIHNTTKTFMKKSSKKVEEKIDAESVGVD